MMLRRTGCPSPAELERAYWARDERVGAHVDACAPCAGAWKEIAALVDAGRHIEPPPVSPQRRDELRTVLLSKEDASEASGRRWSWRFAVPALAAAAALIAFGWWWLGARDEGDRAPVVARTPRAEMLDHGGARYLRASEGAEEIVRLSDGTLTVRVAALAPGERFRLVTGDAELVASDAAFDVTAASDRLRGVRVIRGAVELRAAGSGPRMLHEGEKWTGVIALAPAEPPVPAPVPVPVPVPEAATVELLKPRKARVRERDLTENAPVLDAPPAPLAAQATVDAAPPAPATRVRSEAQRAFADGWSAIRSGQFQAAAGAFERAAGLATDARTIEDARYWRAVALGRDGRVAEAVTAFTDYLATYPRSARAGEASVILGWFELERADLDAAERHFAAGTQDSSAAVRKSAAEGLAAVRRARAR